MSGKSPHPPEVRDAAVWAVTELRERSRSQHQAMELVAREIGVSVGTIRNWVAATLDANALLERLPAASTADAERIMTHLSETVSTSSALHSRSSPY